MGDVKQFLAARSPYNYLQDYIDLFIQGDAKIFFSQVRYPVLIAGEQERSRSFTQNWTQFTKDGERSPLLRDLVRQGHRLAVYEIRHKDPQKPNKVSVGREEVSDLVLPFETISSEHALISRAKEGEAFSISDLDSTNGTSVNGKALEPNSPTQLRDGDTIALGDVVFMFFSPNGLYQAIQLNLDK